MKSKPSVLMANLLVSTFLLALHHCYTVGLTASSFGLGATMSNYFGQQVVEYFGHSTSLAGSLIVSFIPILIFGMFMPETLGARGAEKKNDNNNKTMEAQDNYVDMTR
jgi:Na+/serine symporter